MTFDDVLMVDWSGGNASGPRPRADAIWTCFAGDAPIYHRSRAEAETYLTGALQERAHLGRRTLVGFDICFGFPRGFAKAIVGAPDPLALWDWFEARVEDAPKANNRFDLAARINAVFPGTGPFWGNGLKRDIPHLPRKGLAREGHGLPEHRAADAAMKGAFSPWQLAGAGAVGSQVIMALPTLARLRRSLGEALAVWPFQTPDAPIVLAEVYLSLLGNGALPPHEIRDAAQVSFYADLFAHAPADLMAQMLDVPATEEAWTLGIGFEDRLRSKAALSPPPLRNDCFAMPQGAHWTKVDEALDHLRTHLKPVTGTRTLPLAEAAGRILAEGLNARRSHPPTRNSAVDGYAFAGPAPEGPQHLTLSPGRAAAGVPHTGAVPAGHALRILTGAPLPEGTDTIVLQEDVRTDGSAIAFHGPLRQGANARAAGEDMQAGQAILKPGRKLTSGDIATAIAAGCAKARVHRKLRVAVLSTGDELRNPGERASDAQIYDANRPMLLSDLRSWGIKALDCGIAPDNRDAVAAALDKAAGMADAIITTAGASGGDEDHISALLKDTGSFALWRIAVKPGRPLAMGLWRGKPVFGLPGNPVAAKVCALVFAYPALCRLAGRDWPDPVAFTVPAAFGKSKKAGRREYLRARIKDGAAQVFASEGSGRVSGLSWATGLVELPDEAVTISPGDPVRFIPFSGFR